MTLLTTLSTCSASVTSMRAVLMRPSADLSSCSAYSSLSVATTCVSEYGAGATVSSFPHREHSQDAQDVAGAAESGCRISSAA